MTRSAFKQAAVHFVGSYRIGMNINADPDCERLYQAFVEFVSAQVEKKYQN